MSMSANDINLLLKNYLNSSDGKKYLSEHTIETCGYSDEQMKSMAIELRDAIVQAYLDSVKDPQRYFDMSTVNIGEPFVQIDGRYNLIISFANRGLSRRSLSSSNGQGHGGFTGTGVYDIFGLFTNGYSTNKRVYGFWWDNQTNEGERYDMGRVCSLTSRAPNPFISNAINNFKNKYPDVGVKYPKEWGGMV